MPRRRRPPRPGALADLAPGRILTQIVTLQVGWYGVAIILIVFITFVAGGRPDLEQIFNWHALRGDVTTGWTLGLCWILDSLITVIPILLLIARSKLVPDFGLTIHFIHLVATSVYTKSIPNTFYWWLVQATSAAIMTFVGIWACQWRELKPMMFGGNSNQNRAHTGHATDPALVEEGQGFAMGDRRGRGKDRDGSYEMVGMAPREPG